MRSKTLIELLWQPLSQGARSEVYAVLDGARDEAVLPFLFSSGARHSCLYEGPVPAALLAVAPYLVLLHRESPFTQELLEQAWGKSWGLFVAAPEDPETVRRHLRRFLKVKDEQGRRLYFRYYDPRVMRAYLPTCNEAERQALFGPLQSWLMEGPEGTTLLRYSLGAQGELLEEKWDGP